MVYFLSDQRFNGNFPVALPFFLEFARTERCLSRGLPVQTHMGSLVIVKVDGYLHSIPHLLYRAKGHAHQKLVFDDAVNTLGNGILFGIPTLGHADTYIVVSENVGISETCILYATVRVMDKFTCRLAVKPFQGHSEGLDGEFRLKCLAHTPADDFLCVVVCHYGQVTEVVLAALCVETNDHVGDVAYP